LRRNVGPDRVDVVSFGTLGRQGEAALVHAVSVAKSLGVDLSEHRAQPLPPGALREKDLVIGFEPVHVSTAIATGGAAAEKTFMLLELPDLLEGVAPYGPDVAETRRLIRRMHAARLANAAPPEVLRDPYGEPKQVMAETARLIDTTISHLTAALFDSED
jgi:protein-tyrosine-phosphatase